MFVKTNNKIYIMVKIDKLGDTKDSTEIRVVYISTSPMADDIFPKKYYSEDKGYFQLEYDDSYYLKFKNSSEELKDNLVVDILK